LLFIYEVSGLLPMQRCCQSDLQVLYRVNISTAIE